MPFEIRSSLCSNHTKHLWWYEVYKPDPYMCRALLIRDKHPWYRVWYISWLYIEPIRFKRVLTPLVNDYTYVAQPYFFKKCYVTLLHVIMLTHSWVSSLFREMILRVLIDRALGLACHFKWYVLVCDVTRGYTLLKKTIPNNYTRGAY